MLKKYMTLILFITNLFSIFYIFSNYNSQIHHSSKSRTPPILSGISQVDTIAIGSSRDHYIYILKNYKENRNESIIGIHAFEACLVSLINQYQSYLNQPNKTLILSSSPVESMEFWVTLLQREIIGLKSHISSIKKLEGHHNVPLNVTKTSNDKASLAGLMENVIQGIANEANHLEDTLKQESFEKNINSSSSTVETVLKIDQQDSNKNPKSSSNSSGVSPHAFDKQVTHLIDSDDNEYTLTKSSDISLHYEDSRLLNDLILLLLSSLLGSFLMESVLGLPSFFGCILAGVLLGSFGLISSLIQIDTLSRGLGIIFIMFCLGLEFNFPKIQHIWKLCLTLTLALFILTLAVSLGIGALFGCKRQESIVVGCCISLGSTAVAMNLLSDSERESSTYGKLILGILVIQDILLGFILALLPVLGSSTSLETTAYAFLTIFWSLSVFMMASLLSRRACLLILRRFSSNSQVFLTMTLLYCLLLIQVATYLQVSVEFACFVAGMMISFEEKHSKLALAAISPLKTMFSSLFFASIGLFIYPTFLISQWLVLVSLTCFILLVKLFSTALVTRFCGLETKNAIKISVGLAQISEFSFILSSRAKNGELISRETYFALLGVTVLTLIACPLLWYLGSLIYPPSPPSSKPLLNQVVEQQV